MADDKPKLAWGRLYVGTRHHRKLRILRQRCPESWWIFYPLLEMAFEANDGGLVYLDPDIPFSPSELSIEVGLGSVDLLEATLKSMSELKLVSLESGLVRFLSYNERQFQSDLSAERTRKYREKLKNQSPRHGCDGVVTSPKQGCNGVVTVHDHHSDDEVTPPDTDTDTENRNRKIKAVDAQSPPRPPENGNGNGNGKRQPPAFSCECFEISHEYLEELSQTFPLLPAEYLTKEFFPRMRNWCLDNRKTPKHLKKFDARGRLKTPRSCFANWLKKEDPVRAECYSISPRATCLPEDPPGILVFDPNCPVCHGDPFKTMGKCKCATQASNQDQRKTEHGTTSQAEAST